MLRIRVLLASLLLASTAEAFLSPRHPRRVSRRASAPSLEDPTSSSPLTDDGFQWWLDLRESALLPHEAKLYLQELVDDQNLVVDRVLLSSCPANNDAVVYYQNEHHELVESSNEQSTVLGAIVSCDDGTWIDPLPALDRYERGLWTVLDLHDDERMEMDQVLALTSLVPSKLAIRCTSSSFLMQLALELQRNSGGTSTTESGLLVPDTSPQQRPTTIAFLLPLEVSLWKTSYRLLK